MTIGFCFITNPEKKLISANIVCQNNTTDKTNVVQYQSYDIWKLEIPKIELSANIAEGTDEDILNKYIGHFEETSKKNGNIGLAAHNRGYEVNYFSRLKELEIGDEVIYVIGNNKRYYKVSSINIIDDTDWSNLRSTKDNRITLITCLENEPEKRRCIQAIEKEI